MHHVRCLFCDLFSSASDRVVVENELAYAVRDGFPVTPGHTLIIPKQHRSDYFTLDMAEVQAIDDLLRRERLALLADDSSIQGFNIGMNCGEIAGQTIFHCHVHLIPRRLGDVAEPRGGIRHMIPGKGKY